VNPLRDRPPVKLFGGDGTHDQKVEGALDEIGGLGHAGLGYLQENL
jgi:hypothetical protein